jgi:hypothetical protein
MKRGSLKEQYLAEISPHSGTVTAKLALKPKPEQEARRWELSPILLEGQNVGWMVVKII